MKRVLLLILAIGCLVSCVSLRTSAQIDTLRVMSYNVLNYGDVCLNTLPHLAAHNYLKTIVSFSNPDILGLVKMSPITRSTTDPCGGSQPIGFADSIVNISLNGAFPNRYGHCDITNVLCDKAISVLFYDKNKLGYLSYKTLVSNVSDINLYKFYYKQALNINDTTFIYIVLIHTQSGSAPTATRDAQLSSTLQALKSSFRQLPNLIFMGDFNLHDTNLETGYQTLVSNPNGNYKFNDPPFTPDSTYKYPLQSDSDPSSCPSNLTTSTQVVANVCGTNSTGGGKSWYDHMLISNWLVKNKNHIFYIPKSYKTIGNDGKRLGIAINDSITNGKNTSAPSNVINALWSLSNKYPIMASFRINLNSTVDTTYSAYTDIPQNQILGSDITVYVDGNNIVHFKVANQDLIGKNVTLMAFDVQGKLVFKNAEIINTNFQVQLSTEFSGIYSLFLTDNQFVYKSQRIFLHP